MFVVINKEKVLSYIFVLGLIVFLFCMGTFIKNEKVESMRVNAEKSNELRNEIKNSIDK